MACSYRENAPQVAAKNAREYGLNGLVLTKQANKAAVLAVLFSPQKNRRAADFCVGAA